MCGLCKWLVSGSLTKTWTEPKLPLGAWFWLGLAQTAVCSFWHTAAYNIVLSGWGPRGDSRGAVHHYLDGMPLNGM